MTIAELIAELGGELVSGEGSVKVAGISAFDTAQASTLVFAEDEEGARKALTTAAGAVVLRSLPAGAETAGKAVVATRQPRLWFAQAARRVEPRVAATGVDRSAVVDPTAELGAEISIGPCAVVGAGARIGRGARIGAGAVVGAGCVVGAESCVHARAVLYDGVVLGERVVVHAGAVLGADGFGYVRDQQTGRYTQFPQQGGLVLEDEVEIGANTTIDRGALETTRIGRGTKIDNLVHVGHNCQIGEDVILVALTGISGSSTVGKGAVIAGQVGIGDHAHVGPGVILGGQAGVLSGKSVTNDGLKPGTVLWGTPARPLRQVLRETAVLARLARKGAARE